MPSAKNTILVVRVASLARAGVRAGQSFSPGLLLWLRVMAFQTRQMSTNNQARTGSVSYKILCFYYQTGSCVAQPGLEPVISLPQHPECRPEVIFMLLRYPLCGHSKRGAISMVLIRRMVCGFTMTERENLVTGWASSPSQTAGPSSLQQCMLSGSWSCPLPQYLFDVY